MLDLHVFFSHDGELPDAAHHCRKNAMLQLAGPQSRWHMRGRHVPCSDRIFDVATLVFAKWSFAGLMVAWILMLVVESRGADDPLPGPTWVSDLRQAQQEALKRQVPLIVMLVDAKEPDRAEGVAILGRRLQEAAANPAQKLIVYSPHTIAALSLQVGAISRTRLDRLAVWHYCEVSADDTNPEGRARRRVWLRMLPAFNRAWSLDMTSASGLYVVNPKTMTAEILRLPVIELPGPSHETFAARLETAAELVAGNLKQTIPQTSQAAIRKTVQDAKVADQMADGLEVAPSRSKATRALRHADWVVRYRAFQVFANDPPFTELAQHASLLLETVSAVEGAPKRKGTNEKFRNAEFMAEVFRGLSRSLDPRIAAALTQTLSEDIGLLDSAEQVELLRAIAAVGDAATLKALKPLLQITEHQWVCDAAVDAVAAIARRVENSKPEAVRILRMAYPDISNLATEEDYQRIVKLASRVHSALQQITGRSVEFPENYTRTSRQTLVESW